MTFTGKFLDKVSRGDPIKATMMNEVVAQITRNTGIGAGSQNALSNSAGDFVRETTEKAKYWRGVVSSSHTPSITSDYEVQIDSVISIDSTGTVDQVDLQTGYEITAIRVYSDHIIFPYDKVSGLIVNGVYLILWPKRQVFYGKTSVDILSSLSGVGNVWRNQDPSDPPATFNLKNSGLTVFGYNMTSQDIKAGTFIEITPHPGSSDITYGRHWVFKPLSCS